MTPEAQRIAIAEACPELWLGGYIQDGMPLKHIRGDIFQPLDFLTDLNAMHEAERGLNQVQRNDFRIILESAHGKECIHATAAQRAEAFLKTIGKWRDE